MSDRTITQFLTLFRVPLLLVGILFGIHWLKSILGWRLGIFGIYPREVEGLAGIIMAPWIHSDMQHLISNAVPTFMLSFIILFFYKRVAISAMLLMYLLTGLSVWLFARPVYHIGASGVVYAMVSFIFWNGIFRRNIKSIVLALAATVLYSGYFAGILPNQDGISWESHLYGAIVGIFVSFVFMNVLEADEINEDPWADELNEAKQYFLPRDIFDKTLAQRYAEEMERRRQEQSLD